MRMGYNMPLIMHVVIALFCSVCCSASPPPSRRSISVANSTDLTACLAFSSSLASDPRGALASWNRTLHICRWRGVTCGGRRHPGRVVGLDLHSLNLSGAVPTSIANLTFLRRLDLSDNNFHGGVPEELGRLFRLRHLNLSFNSLSGWIPASLGHCPALEEIRLRNNMLAGTVPLWLGNLSSLSYLSLRGNRLSGRIPPSFGNLTSLTVLSLGSNALVGGIPRALGNLHGLLFLDLSNNSLSGTIPPSFGNLSSLESTMLSGNHLMGSIPPSLGGLPSLVELDLSRNSLTRGIPPSLWNLTHLAVLSLGSNSLVGAIPPDVGNLVNLTFFSVGDNRLAGPVPLSLYNLSSLIILHLASNRFSGSLPPNMGNSLPNLEFLSVGSNHFHGPIPSSIINATRLQRFQLYMNKFSGTVPSGLGTLTDLQVLLLYDNQLEGRDGDGWRFLTSLANCTHLRELSLADNRLGGQLPPAISNLSTDLRLLDLGSNRISGSIPETIGDLVGLTIFSVAYNLLGGTIPAAIGRLQRLSSLLLLWNRFSGQIPSSIFNITQLNHLHLEGNRLQGSLSPSFGKLQNLLGVNLSHNKFTSAVPKELVSISSLSILLDLSHNLLSGYLPAEVGQLRNLNSMDISGNQLSGGIPSTLGDCEVLEVLRMEGNAFQGTVPQTFGKLRGLRVLDLSRNHLSGAIPKVLQNLSSLSYLNLSFNDLDGEVPKGGIFQNATAVSVLGNNKLCGGIPELHLKACSRDESKKHHRNIRSTVIIAVSVTVLCLVALTLYLVFYSKRKSSRPMAHDSHELVARITYSELFKATEGFSPANLIGVGSFGSVYKAKMEPTYPSGHLVAVKVINLQQRGASKSFMAECEALRNIRHRNLLKILTSCSSIDSSGNDFKALVFEFMPNGSLDQWLHPREYGDDGKCLSLVHRLNIAVDVASALSYLHHHSHTPVVHRDLKPSNVLLDDDMTAHVGDFGLARFLGQDDNRNPTSSLAVRGSIGYVAPEYGMGCNASTEGDVFSYGVLLLEMLTGRRPTDSCFPDDLSIHKFVETMFPGRVLEVADPCLLTDQDVGNGHGISQEGMNNNIIQRQRRQTCLVSMARLGLLCSKESPRERIGMEVVVKEVTAVRDDLMGSRVQGRAGN